MKTVIILMLLLTITACGKGSGSSSGSPAANNGTSDFTNRPVSNYELRVNGCNGSTFTMVAFTNPGEADEVRHDMNGALDGSGTTSINVPGKAIEWQIDSISGGCQLDMVLTRTAGNATFIATDIVANNGQSGYIQDY